MKTEGLVMEISLDNQGVQINRHRVELNKNYCIEYSKDQSLSSFYERSKNIDNEDLIIEQYKQLKLIFLLEILQILLYAVSEVMTCEK